MKYWTGLMNWSLKKDWVCETCGEYKGLEWGLPHALCRCVQCHTEYRMRDSEDRVVEVPVSQLKEEYKTPAQHAWQRLQIPINELTEEDWRVFMQEGVKK